MAMVAAAVWWKDVGIKFLKTNGGIDRPDCLMYIDVVLLTAIEMVLAV